MAGFIAGFIIAILLVLLYGEYIAEKAYKIFISRHVHDMTEKEILKELRLIMYEISDCSNDD